MFRGALDIKSKLRSADYTDYVDFSKRSVDRDFGLNRAPAHKETPFISRQAFSSFTLIGLKRNLRNLCNLRIIKFRGSLAGKRLHGLHGPVPTLD